MRTETGQFLANAEKLLERGRRMLTVQLYEDAARAAYLACFHAAQALIFENENRVVKTHRGVQAEFHRLTQRDPDIPAELRSFLSRAYAFKTIADYDLGGSIQTAEPDARAAIETADRFVVSVANAIQGAGSVR